MPQKPTDTKFQNKIPTTVRIGLLKNIFLLVSFAFLNELSPSKKEDNV